MEINVRMQPVGKHLTLSIDPEFRALCPTQTAEELAHLDASIDEEGCRDPIIVWANHNDTILDGHTRYERCVAKDIPFKIKALSFPDRHAAANWIIRNQLGRRNATEEQKAYLRGKWYLDVKGEQGGDHRSKGQTDPLIGLVKHGKNAAQSVGDATGVSEKTVKRDAAFADAVDALATKSPALKVAALAGELPKSSVPALAELPKAALKPLAKLEGSELREAARELVSPAAEPRGSTKRPTTGPAKKVKDATAGKGGRPTRPTHLFARMESQLGGCLRAIDNLHRAAPAEKFHRDALRFVKEAMQTIKEWHTAVA